MFSKKSVFITKVKILTMGNELNIDVTPDKQYHFNHLLFMEHNDYITTRFMADRILKHGNKEEIDKVKYYNNKLEKCILDMVKIIGDVNKRHKILKLKQDVYEYCKMINKMPWK